MNFEGKLLKSDASNHLIHYSILLFLKHLKNGTALKIKRPSMICSQWDVVVVPFPFTDEPGAKKRPALVITNMVLTETVTLFLP